jgi:hypothetical protein
MAIRIDKMIPGDIVTLDFCTNSKDSGNQERAMFVGHIGYGPDRRAEFACLDERGKVYEWEAYRYNGGWAYGSGAARLKVVSLDAPGPIIPEDFPVKVLKFGGEAVAHATQCGTCHRFWDDSVSTSMTPVPSGRCPFEYFHADTDALLVFAATS